VESYTTFEMFCGAAYRGEIDGMTTSEVAEKFGLKTAEAWRWLRTIVTGKARYYPGTFDAEMNGVETDRPGRFFTYNGGEDGRRKSECCWFCN
jgi:hypothetical protein